jgi:hypothetical protein
MIKQNIFLKLILPKSLIGQHFGRFFANSSGHPGSELVQVA